MYLLLWTYDKARLWGACAMPRLEDSVPDITALAFLHPFPGLAAADDRVRHFIMLAPCGFFCAVSFFHQASFDVPAVLLWFNRVLVVQGCVMIWSVPPAKSAGILRAVWYTPDRDPCMVLHVTALANVPKMKGVWSAETSTPFGNSQFGECYALPAA